MRYTLGGAVPSVGRKVSLFHRYRLLKMPRTKMPWESLVVETKINFKRKKKMTMNHFSHSLQKLGEPIPTPHRSIGVLLELSLAGPVPLSGFSAMLNPIWRILEGKNSKPTASLIWFWILCFFYRLLAAISFSEFSNSFSKHSVQVLQLHWVRKEWYSYFFPPNVFCYCTHVENHIWCFHTHTHTPSPEIHWYL